MPQNSLEIFVAGVRKAWEPLSSELIAECRSRMEALLEAPTSEAWLAALHREAPENQELYRDPVHGFLLLAHVEMTGRYRPPHDHGRGWVFYGIQQGEVEVVTYAKAEDPDGRVRLVRREAYLLRPGQCRVYLPGDIHDTRSVAGPVLMYRFTSRDLAKEDKVERQMTRYVERDGVFRIAAA